MRRVDMKSSLIASRTDRAIIYDTMSELAARVATSISARPWGNSWMDGLTRDDAARFARDGDESRVAASDAFMAKLEDKFEFHTGRFRTIDAIAGGCPNVAAFIAGAPLAMRRRQRVADDMAPLTIVVDTTSSGGIGANDLERRGAAILALVRLLATRRPVTLYAGAAMGNSVAKADGINAVMTRIETAPLDLARAAFLLAHPGAARGVGYGVVVDEFKGADGHIPWPYNSADKARTYAPDFWARVFPGTEILCVPAVFSRDASIATPDVWLADKLAKYGGMENAAVAA